MSVKDYYDEVRRPLVLQIGCDTENRITIDISNKFINDHVVMDATKMKFREEMFDKVRARGSLECADFLGVLHEVDRVLKYGGTFEFTLQRDSWWIRLYRKYFRKPHPKDDYFLTKQYTLPFIKSALAYHGFTIQKVQLLYYRSIWCIYAVK